MQGNSVPVPGYNFSGVADRGRQMAAYDELPAKIRRAIDDAPFEICCIATLKFFKKNREEKTMNEIKESVDLFLERANAK